MSWAQDRSVTGPCSSLARSIPTPPPTCASGHQTRTCCPKKRGSSERLADVTRERERDDYGRRRIVVHRGLMCDGSMIGPSLQDCRGGRGKAEHNRQREGKTWQDARPVTQKDRAKEADLPKGTIIPHNCRISLSPIPVRRG